MLVACVPSGFGSRVRAGGARLRQPGTPQTRGLPSANSLLAISPIYLPSVHMDIKHRAVTLTPRGVNYAFLGMLPVLGRRLQRQLVPRCRALAAKCSVALEALQNIAALRTGARALLDIGVLPKQPSVIRCWCASLVCAPRAWPWWPAGLLPQPRWCDHGLHPHGVHSCMGPDACARPGSRPLTAIHSHAREGSGETRSRLHASGELHGELSVRAKCAGPGCAALHLVPDSREPPMRVIMAMPPCVCAFMRCDSDPARPGEQMCVCVHLVVLPLDEDVT